MPKEPLTLDQIAEVVGTDEDRERWAAQDAFLQHEMARQDQLTADVLASIESDRERFISAHSTEGYLDREAEQAIEKIREERARRRR